MNLFRLLLLFAVAWLVWRLFQSARRRQLDQRPPQEQFEPMARCSSCGTYLPAKALSRDGRCGRCSE